MILQPGGQLGDYRIIEPIGAGGMGQVYLAEVGKWGQLLTLDIFRRWLASERSDDPAERW